MTDTLPSLATAWREQRLQAAFTVLMLLRPFVSHAASDGVVTRRAGRARGLDPWGTEEARDSPDDDEPTRRAPSLPATCVVALFLHGKLTRLTASTEKFPWIQRQEN